MTHHDEHWTSEPPPDDGNRYWYLCGNSRKPALSFVVRGSTTRYVSWDLDYAARSIHPIPDPTPPPLPKEMP